MEEAKQRKEEQRLKIQMEEERKWKEIQAYNPWGKPGAGAPTKPIEPFGAIVPRERASPAPSRSVDPVSPSLSPQNSLPAPAPSFSPPSASLMSTHPEGGRKFMGALSSMNQSEAEQNAQAEKRLQYKRDLEEQMKMKEMAKAQDPLAIQRSTPRGHQASIESHSPNSTMQQTPPPQTPPPAPEKIDVSPKFTRKRFEHLDSSAQEEHLRKQRERQEHMEALQKQLAEKRRLQELEKQREDEKFLRLYRASEEPPISEAKPNKEVVTPVSEPAKPAGRPDSKSGTKPDAKPETKPDPILEILEAKESDSKPAGKPKKDEEKTDKKRHSNKKGRRRRRSYHTSSESESGSSQESESDSRSDDSGSSSEGDKDRRRRRRHHHRRRSRGKAPDESTLALVKQAIEEEQAKLQRLLLLQQQQQLQLQQQQIQLQQQQLIAPTLYQPSLPKPEVTDPNKTITSTKPPPILDTTRKNFLAQIDPETVLANGRVVIDKSTSSFGTQTTARPHTTNSVVYQPSLQGPRSNFSVTAAPDLETGASRKEKRESISRQMSSTAPERPGTSTHAETQMSSTAPVRPSTNSGDPSRTSMETEMPRRPRRDESVRQSLTGDSKFIFPLKADTTSNAFAIFGDREKDASPVLESASSMKSTKSELRIVDPIFAEKPPDPMFVAAPHLPYDPSFHDEAALKREKKKKQKDLPPSLPSTHRGPKPDSSAVVSSKSTMDIDTLYKINERRLKNLQDFIVSRFHRCLDFIN
eukprot:Phypoly_transcript_01304.p1 GENE.Phypoly_transcript_01304~~Phypoly_transcript_01304.p1  ORF type:complete len:752 (+),score=176.41 Phypoly_transcript_01304:928-3183(+)